MDKGQCACGKVSFEITGEPINAAFCYCTDCQLHTNSDKWFGLWVNEEDLRFTELQPETYVRKGQSGMDMVHHFCGDCGVTLAIFVEVAGFYSVAANTLANKERYRPEMLIYTKNAAPWAVYPQGVPKFDILPPEMMG